MRLLSSLQIALQATHIFSVLKWIVPRNRSMKPVKYKMDTHVHQLHLTMMIFFKQNFVLLDLWQPLVALRSCIPCSLSFPPGVCADIFPSLQAISSTGQWRLAVSFATIRTSSKFYNCSKSKRALLWWLLHSWFKQTWRGDPNHHVSTNG